MLIIIATSNIYHQVNSGPLNYSTTQTDRPKKNRIHRNKVTMNNNAKTHHQGSG